MILRKWAEKIKERVRRRKVRRIVREIRKVDWPMDEREQNEIARELSRKAAGYPFGEWRKQKK